MLFKTYAEAEEDERAAFTGGFWSGVLCAMGVTCLVIAAAYFLGYLSIEFLH